MLVYVLLGIGSFPIVPIALSQSSTDGQISPTKASGFVFFVEYSGLLFISPTLGQVALATLVWM